MSELSVPCCSGDALYPHKCCLSSASADWKSRSGGYLNLSWRLVSPIVVKAEAEHSGLTKIGYSQDRQTGTPGHKCSLTVFCHLRPKRTLIMPLGFCLAVTGLVLNTPSLNVEDGLDSSTDLSGLISNQDCECVHGNTFHE